MKIKIAQWKIRKNRHQINQLIRNRNHNTSPSTGQHQPDIQGEKLKRKHGNRPQGRDEINRDEFPNDNPGEYNDGAPVEEKSPRISNSL